MLENCKDAQERWGGVHQLIDHWLGERQELIQDFYRLQDDPQLASYTAPRASAVRHLCQVLMDYVSAGHFEVYDQLASEAEAFGDTNVHLLDDLMPGIQATTGTALDFNDAFDSDSSIRDGWDKLPTRLNRLGDALAARFELEDRLIQRLHTAHQQRSLTN